MRFVQAGFMVLGALTYLVVLFLVTTDGLTYYNVRPILLTGVVWNALVLVVAVLVIIDSTRKLDAGKTRELISGVFLVKLVAIPFFVINFAMMVLLALAGSFILIFGGFAMIAIAVNSIGLTYLAMLSTSVYGFAALVRLRREGRIDKTRAVIYTVLLCIFVADIVVAVMLYVQERRARKLALSSEVVAEAGHDPATSRL